MHLMFTTSIHGSCFKETDQSHCNTPNNNNNNRLGSVTTLQDNNKIKAIEI
jgi:hypothetical protein